MKLCNDWKDYELIDASKGQKYERWGNVYLLRPDPQAVWDNGDLSDKYSSKIDAIYYRSKSGGGHWENIKNVPGAWTINYKNLTFNIKQMGFKHTGLFPEQAVNWDYSMNKIKNANRPIKVLNLFAYTGAATMAASKAGAELVVQVDASKGMTEWAKENMKLCKLENNKIRFIVDDCLKFVEREARRGNKYDVIIMDPPSYGRGPNGEMWKFEKNLDILISKCLDILSDKPLFFLINSYTTGISSTVLYNILKTSLYNKYKGNVSAGEIGLPITDNNLVLPCGIYGLWEE